MNIEFKRMIAGALIAMLALVNAPVMAQYEENRDDATTTIEDYEDTSTTTIEEDNRYPRDTTPRDTTAGSPAAGTTTTTTTNSYDNDHSNHRDRHRGPYIELGGGGAIDTGIPNGDKLFDLGPLAHGGLGYNWSAVGIRGSFLYTGMDFDHTPVTFDMLGGGLDMKIFPLQFGDRHFELFQPYLVLGVGGYYMEPELGNSADGDAAIGGNAGLGFDINLSEHVGIGFENNFRPLLFFNDVNVNCNNFDCNDNSDLYDLYLYSFMGFIKFMF